MKQRIRATVRQSVSYIGRPVSQRRDGAVTKAADLGSCGLRRKR
jgi:hypothetical protein